MYFYKYLSFKYLLIAKFQLSIWLISNFGWPTCLCAWETFYVLGFYLAAFHFWSRFNKYNLVVAVAGSFTSQIDVVRTKWSTQGQLLFEALIHVYINAYKYTQIHVERERDRDRQTDRERERENERERQRQRQRETETERQTGGDRERRRETDW